MKRVYLDNAATTMLNGEVLQEMMPYLTSIYGNSSSLHSFGREAVSGVDSARDKIAKYLDRTSDLYTDLRTSEVKWVNEHSGYYIEDTNLSELFFYDSITFFILLQ